MLQQALSVAAALEYIQEHIVPVTETEELTLNKALARVLARDIIAPLSVPMHRGSAMDGYAMHSQQLTGEGPFSLGVVGSAFAGKPFQGTLNTNSCVRIMTGAKVPDACDTVIIQENVQRDGDTIHFEQAPLANQNIRLPGEDITAGECIFTKGHRITPADIGVLASLGITTVPVYRQLTVAFFSTGDELKPSGSQLADGEIYDSNRHSLKALLQQSGAIGIDLGLVADSPEALKQTLLNASESADVILSTGGVSVGDADYINSVLAELGELNLWKIAMKPGKPLSFGKIGKAIFLGLPGNPVSVMATFYIIVLPSLRYLMGYQHTQPLRYRAVCATALKKRPGRMDFQRGILSHGNNGELQVDSTGAQGSHRLSSMSKANCFIVIPAEQGDIAAGTVVDIIPFDQFK